jgi:hypothetical protein
MQTYALKTRTPPVVSLIDWVAEDRRKAAEVGAGLIVVGVAILVLVAIFSS